MNSPDAKTAKLTSPEFASTEAPHPHDTARRIADRVKERLFSEPSPTTQIARFVVLDRVGRGGMGTVYSAYDPQLDRKVAVKVLREDDLPNEEDRHRFLREAKALARLSHPHVVTVHEVGEADGELFLAMEFILGQDLAKWLGTEPGWRAALEAFVQAGEGLAAVHDTGLVHRDLKPHNIMRRDDGVVKLLDFGLARAIDDTIAPSVDGALESTSTVGADSGSTPGLSSSLTRPGTVMGTPAYMPPEQMMGGDVDARSDQFSFCVALYEALYGERPFPGDTMRALMGSMQAGRIRAAPKDRPVPARLRTVLARGLQVEPADRWPSMHALLDQLRAVLAPRQWRWWGAGALAALGLGLVGIGQAYRADVEQRCTGAAAQLEGIWDEERRQAVSAAILGTELPYARDTWTLVESRLDAYCGEWTAKHTETCEATAVRHEQSDAVMELRMRCLSERRTALRASVDVLASADAEVVENAATLATSLPALTSCDDPAWLEQQAQRMPPPEDPAVADEVEAQRERLAEVEAMFHAGRYDQALETIEDVVARAQALEYPPLSAEALSWRGDLREEVSLYDEAEQDLRQAHALAVEHGHDEIALDTAQTLTLIVGNVLARHAEGRQWAQMEALPLARRSGDPAEVAISLNRLASVYYGQGEYDDVVRLCREALGLSEEARGADDLSVSGQLECLGHASSALGHHDDARGYYERALQITELQLGGEHPLVASMLNSLANEYLVQEEFEEAESRYQRALAIERQVRGPDHPGLAFLLNGLGNVYQAQGKYEEAIANYQRSLAAKRESLGAGHPEVAKSLNNLGNAFAFQGKYTEAKAYFEQALPILEEALGPTHPHVAYLLNNLGVTYQNLEDYDVAQQYLQRALEVRQKELGAEHPIVIATLDNLGDLHEARGQIAEAQEFYERTLTMRQSVHGAEHPEVTTSLNRLGSVLVDQGRCEEARVHHQRALEIQQKASGSEHPSVARGLVGLGGAAECAGQHEEAKGYYERALAIHREDLGDDHVDVAGVLVGLATATLGLGDRAAARAHAERAVAIHEAAAYSPENLAEARFVLALALWGTQPTRARALAEQARETLARSRTSGKTDVTLGDVEAWLAKHRIR